MEGFLRNFAKEEAAQRLAAPSYKSLSIVHDYIHSATHPEMAALKPRRVTGAEAFGAINVAISQLTLDQVRLRVLAREMKPHSPRPKHRKAMK
jgi:hypothetical protein